MCIAESWGQIQSKKAEVARVAHSTFSSKMLLWIQVSKNKLVELLRQYYETMKRLVLDGLNCSLDDNYSSQNIFYRATQLC